MSVTIIGITGPAESGKDKLAGILDVFHGYFRIGLADAVKSSFDDLSGPTRAPHKYLSDDFSQRRAWQLLGTECREETDFPCLWVGVIQAKIQFLVKHCPRPFTQFVVPDVSYAMEAVMLRGCALRLGGRYETWRVERPGVQPIADEHSSEVGRRTLKADRTLLNDGTTEDLRREVCRLLGLMG